MPPRKPVRPQPTNRDEVKTIGLESTTRRPVKHPVSKNNKQYWEKTGRFFKSEITHFVVGMMIFVILLLVSVGMISYFSTGAEDQSLMELSWSQLHESRNEIQNTTKVAGAVISHSLIHEGFGISSFAMLFFAFVIAFRLIKVKIISLSRSFFHASFWLVWLSLSLGFIDVYYKPDLFFRLGGQHGVFACEWLVSYIGEIGLLLSLSGIFLAYLIIAYQGTIPAIKSLFSKKTASSKVQQQTDEKNALTVAIGTEIVPEDWVSKGNEEKKFAGVFDVEKITEEEPVAASVSDVPFEIEKPFISDENKPIDAAMYNGKNEENEDPFYTVEKLGKYDPTLDLSKYSPPSLNLLKVYGTDNETHIDMKEQNANKERITTTLQNYGIEIKTIKATVGPTITLYEIVPKEGVRISKIKNLEYDIMLSLAATGIRIIAPIPGKGTIGIEVPNADPQIVSMHSVIASRKFQDSGFELPVAFGRTITNEIFMVDLTKLPHLLVAGATGQGKSVGLNAIITSLLYKKHPAELKLVLIDPKKVEFNIYGDIERHFLAKLPDSEDAIITDTTKVLETLSSLCKEMDNRYDLLKKAHVRNIREYNEKFVNRHLNPEKGHQYLPYIVVIVDEFGDLIMTAGKEVELPIARIAQLARAVGIHMIIATQRPSVNIITGVIKANFPARVAFRVSSMIDSRTIIDGPGANQLVGRGDMLFTSGNEIIRVQCAFVDTPEVENIVHHVARQPSYPCAYYLPEYTGSEGDGPDLSSIDMSKRDPLFEDAARLIVATQQGSTSNIQRKFSIGYNRAGRIVDQMEVAGIIGPNEGSKARQVLVMDEYHLEQILKHLH